VVKCAPREDGRHPFSDSADGGYPWVRITGRREERWLTDDDVRDWPIQHPVSVEGAMAKLRREKPQGRPAPELVGDMDVEAFKGGADG
jgi:hypothetical protein